MKKIVWDDATFCVGIAKIDDQHKQLVSLINALAQVSSGNDEDKSEFLKKVLNTLIEYTQNHFTAEEKILKKMHFADLAGHCLQHKRFVSQVKTFHAAFVNSPDSKILIEKIVDFLGNWLTQHILVEDKEWADFLFS